MTNDDAIKWLENLKQDIGQIRHEDLCPYAQAIDEICGLLKEKEPVRPKKWIPKGQILARVRGYYCPVCNTGISQGDRFCHRCGRAVKWDD